MANRLTALVGLLALLICCGDDTRFVVVVQFPDDASKQETEQVRVVVVKPGEGADCAALFGGDARPGDDGYDIEDEVVFDLEGMEGARALKVPDAGLRLFFAEALDINQTPILRGCVEAEAGQGRVAVITIILERLCRQDQDCDNGVWCDGDEHCVGGRCESGERDCSDSDICTQDLCNEDLDACENPPVEQPPAQEGPAGDTSCDDGVDNDCDGMTDGNDPGCIVCQSDAECADNNACTSDVCDQQACVNDPVDDGTTCDDELFCTIADECTNGRCGGTARDCSGLTNQCNQGSCNEDTNECDSQPANEGQTCDDGLYCTMSETCQSGSCVGNTQRDCQDDDPCTQDRCDETSNQCQSILVPRPGQEGYDVAGTCTDGLDNDCDRLIDDADSDCQECHQDSDCDDGNSCTTNTCDLVDNHCDTTFVTDGTVCDDGLLCTDPDACSAGVCSGTAIDCTSLDDDCNLGFCNETSGQCEPQPVNQGQACQDGVYCTTGETCQDGACAGGTDRDCSGEDDQCNLGVCNEGSGACEKQTANEGLGCDDGLYCVIGEVCESGTCVGTQARDCDDAEECTQDACDDALDQCTNDPLPDGTECGSRSCVGLDLVKEVCQSGTCSGNEVLSCDDGVPCTADSCDPAGCQNTPNAGGCPDIHIGPAADTCPHDDGGGPITTCDFTGTTGLEDAAASAPVEGANFLIYDDLGTLAVYTACTLDIPGGSYLGAAPGVDPKNVQIYCDEPGTWPNEENGVLHLDGDNIHVERLTIVVTARAKTAISAWIANNDNTVATGGHLIENITSMALHPEVWGSNSIQEPVYLGPDNTLRNSHFYGYFENNWNLTNADNSLIVNNTFMFFQSVGDADVSGSSGVVIANNVFAALTAGRDEMITGDLTTTGLTVTGNAIEGFTSVVAGLDPADTTNVVQDNSVGPLGMESPYLPLFLSDSATGTGTVVPGEGVSLDGTPVEGQTGILPGAYQDRSNLSLPRRTTIKVGEDSNGCNGPCDITQAADNEIQLAAWSAWPGGTVEIYPTATPYAGNAIIGWPITIEGRGTQPEDVIVQSMEEEPDWTYYGMWGRHDSVLVLLKAQGSPLLVTNLTIRVDANSVTNKRAVMTEYTDPLEMDDNYWHEFRRIRVESVNTGAGLDWAFYLGDRVHIQDVLIHGDFHSCIRFGMRRSTTHATPATTCHVVNLTCRLTGSGAHAPESFFDVASVTDTIMTNLALDWSTPISQFRAQRQSVGDTAADALDQPVSYVYDSVTRREYTEHSNGFDPTVGVHIETNVDSLLLADPFFVSAADSHLDAACTSAIDGGVDPSTHDARLSPGVSLDGVDRAGMTIDRGCYEEGQ